MAKTIGLRVELDGVEVVVSSIKQLETEIGRARERLSGLNIGTDEFKKLSGQIQNADSKLKDLKKSAEGLESVQQAEAFAKVAGGITTAFAAAQAAVQLFGAESEEVTQAVAKAQQVLTIAIAARGIAEAALNIKIVANIVAQRAAALATIQTNVATKALFATIAANPIGALITVIGLAVTALFSLTDATDDATDAEENYQKTLEKTNQEREYTLRLLKAQGASELEIAQKSRANAQKDLSEARALLNVYNQQGASQQLINVQLQRVKDSKLIIAEETKKINDLEAAGLQKLSEQEKKRFEERKSQLQQEIAIREDLIRKRLEENLASRGLDEIEFNFELQKRLDLLKSLTNGYQEQTDVLTRYKQVFGNVADEVIVDFNDLQKISGQFDELRKGFGEKSGFGQEEFLGDFEISESTVASVNEFGETIFKVNFALVDLATKTTSVLDERLDGVAVLLKQLQLGFGNLGKSVDEDLRNRFSQAVATITDFEAGLNNSLTSVLNARNDLDKIRQEFIAGYVETNLTVQKGQVGYETAFSEVTKTAQSLFDTLVKNQKEIRTFGNDLDKARNNATSLAKEIKKLQSDINSLNAFLSKNSAAVADLLKVDVTDIEQNRKDILAIDQALASGRFDNLFQFSQDIEFLEYELAQQGIDISKASQEEKLKILKEFLQKEIDATVDAENKKKEAGKATIGTFIDSLQAYGSELGKLNGVLRSFTQETLDALEKQNQEVLDTIVGTSEEANQKRLEQEQIFNEKKKQIEKEARIQELRLTFAQAIADGAGAVIAAARTPAVIPLVIAVNAAQLSLIQSQIQATQSLQRGGLIKSMGLGGLLEGPSHEEGGIRLAQTGVIAEGGEAVINRVSSVQYRDLLSNINMAGGGVPLVNGGFDDSRILEALAKQRSEPIRAYVQEQEITNKQAISRRLEQLSSL